MSLRFLLDTDVIIWHLRGHKKTEELLVELEPEQPLSCSALSVFEVWAGIRPEDKETTHNFISALFKIPVDGEIAMKAADYWREFRNKGVTLGQADAMIAATASVNNLIIVTYNSSHYPMKDVETYYPMPHIE
ncbi:PIN domain-containing protein [Candidatus Poribacteria bacterium]|nr:PIN domain-containing protein [Candidatus Poribacteria bacterium]